VGLEFEKCCMHDMLYSEFKNCCIWQKTMMGKKKAKTPKREL
jgi:hypothetical protein